MRAPVGGPWYESARRRPLVGEPSQESPVSYQGVEGNDHFRVNKSSCLLWLYRSGYQSGPAHFRRDLFVTNDGVICL